MKFAYDRYGTFKDCDMKLTLYKDNTKRNVDTYILEGDKTFIVVQLLIPETLRTNSILSFYFPDTKNII